MTSSNSAFTGLSGQRFAALSRWENEGGALEHATLDGLASLGVPPLSNTELVQLRIRVVALENLLLALLAEGTAAQTTLAREMASYILPREGHTPHPLTIHAAQQMLQLLERAARFKRAGS
ncbi:MAG: hypothetical protein M3Y55_19040 [Pseudomonadota bacterium]|nr:hypothetical protein [Pseudomonadota bacterium]